MFYCFTAVNQSRLSSFKTLKSHFYNLYFVFVMNLDHFVDICFHFFDFKGSLSVVQCQEKSH